MIINNDKWLLSDNLTSQNYTKTLKTAGTFVDKDVNLDLTVQTGTWNDVIWNNLTAALQSNSAYSNGVLNIPCSITGTVTPSIAKEGWFNAGNYDEQTYTKTATVSWSLVNNLPNFNAGNIVKGVDIAGIVGTGANDTELTLSNTLPSGATESDYADISSTAPVLISGSYLYLTEGRLNQNSKISLAQLVPDAANLPSSGSSYLLSGYSAYTKDGTLVAGNIENLAANYLTSTYEVTKSTDGLYAKLDVSGAQGKYIDSTSNYVSAYLSNSDIVSSLGLTAAQIKAGESILGLTGTFTADATATADSIQNNKTAYVNGNKITGTVPLYADERTYTVNQTSIVDSNSTYLDVSATNDIRLILTDTVPVHMQINKSSVATTIGLTADKIISGTTILNITGTVDYIKTVEEVPATKDTSIIYCSTDGRYYLWNDGTATNLITDEY